ncbi:DUF2586 domain-containing protein [Ferrimonas senticii]|uniref:DUF2586 domain-containing protein n=1 Tax=Ferrimonas senticii TaxID=394566 RepID=UPI000428E562|nr:DUF2586 domain-containing protein [Ferrimonas senticii]
MYPTINVALLNQGQGSGAEIERHFLFIGPCAAAQEKGVLLNVNTETDFDRLLGEDDTELKTTLRAAMLNAGSNWTAGVWVLPDGQDWYDAAMAAQKVGSFEAIVRCSAVADQADITKAQELHSELVAKWARWSFVMLPLRGLQTEAARSAKTAATVTESWSQYHTAMTALLSGAAAHGVMVVPPTHGNNLGVLAGRLCNRSVTVADSPMRVKTGPLIGLGSPVLDSAGLAVDSATLQAMEKERMNVPATFPDYDGTYWADGRTLDTDTGDFQVIENLRVLMKGARIVRLKAIPMIADRAINSSASSIASTKTLLAAPLRQMAKSSKFGNATLPGEIKPPGDEAVSITWLTRTNMQVYLSLTPWHSPKSIGIGLGLDLSGL